MQFHSALLENGVTSVLVTYPEEGHGIRKLPAMIDYSARLVGWFNEHMLANDFVAQLMRPPSHDLGTDGTKAN